MTPRARARIRRDPAGLGRGLCGELVTGLASAATRAGAQLFKGTLSLPFAFLLFLDLFFSNFPF